jgi:hypothetical protein
MLCAWFNLWWFVSISKCFHTCFHYIPFHYFRKMNSSLLLLTANFPSLVIYTPFFFSALQLLPECCGTCPWDWAEKRMCMLVVSHHPCPFQILLIAYWLRHTFPVMPSRHSFHFSQCTLMFQPSNSVFLSNFTIVSDHGFFCTRCTDVEASPFSRFGQ